MKKFAFYLPQFHEIEENNMWWGKGFTEWTNVKAAEVLFKNHIQPIHPVGDNYYNLLNRSTIEWQTTLMHNYGIDGFIYYHYYFKGKKLLEKPAENLIKWKEIRQSFFFCWANHDWNRSWEGSKELLIKQEYGKEKDWEAHFRYLLDFFKDERYEKKDNQPLFMIFNCDFVEKKKLIEYFDKRCKEEGFAGIYLIETFHAENVKKGLSYFKNNMTNSTKKIYIREPAVSRYKLNYGISKPISRFWRKIKKEILTRKGKGLIVINKSDELYSQMMKYKLDDDCIYGMFFSFDNTPRHKEWGSVILPPTKKKFIKVMNFFSNEEYLFFNAWNEWAEGMILEPTIEYGYEYLDWIKEVCEKI